MRYDFDAVIDRYGTRSVKWDFAERSLGVKDALPMWVADMDFRSPDEVIEAMLKAARHGVFGYSAPGDGYYEAFMAFMEARHNLEVRREWVEFSPGVVPAINFAVRAYCSPGDEVLVQTPGYYPFFRAVQNNGCTLVTSPLRMDNGRYVMDFEDMEKKVTPRTRLAILCSPHNPVGRVWGRDELLRFGEFCLRHKLVILADEIHSDLVYKPYRHTNFATLGPELLDNCVLCTGVSKTFNLPALQTSNIVIPNPELRRRFHEAVLSAGLHFGNVFGIAATEAAYRYGATWLDELIAYLQGNVEYLVKYIAEKLPAIRLAPPEGTYLAWLDCRALPVPLSKVKTFMCSDAHVGLEEGTVFGAPEPGFWRMNFGCPRSVLDEGLRRMEGAIRSLPLDGGG